MVRVRWVVVRLDRNEEILQLLDSGYEIQQFIALDEISEHERQRMSNLFSVEFLVITYLLLRSHGRSRTLMKYVTNIMQHLLPEEL